MQEIQVEEERACFGCLEVRDEAVLGQGLGHVSIHTTHFTFAPPWFIFCYFSYFLVIFIFLTFIIFFWTLKNPKNIFLIFCILFYYFYYFLWHKNSLLGLIEFIFLNKLVNNIKISYLFIFTLKIIFSYNIQFFNILYILLLFFLEQKWTNKRILENNISIK